VTRAPAALRLVADRAQRALAEAAACGPVPRAGDRIAVAVSGGADSLALLHALRTLAGPRGWLLEVVTVDHRLRPDPDGGSAADAAFVADHAAALGLGARVLTLAAADLARHRHAGPEAAARAARYQALGQAAAAAGCAWVATGHTLDDQAETVLLQLLRGAGPDGLAGMAVVGELPWTPALSLLRPLLAVRRAETRACCRALGLAWREDPSNADQRLLRNAVRSRVLPLLEELRPGSAATLARTAALAREDRAWAEQAAAHALDQTLDGATGDGATGGGAVALDASVLVRLPLGLARRVVRAAAARAGRPQPDATATEALLDLARGGRPGDAAPLPGGPPALRTPGGVLIPPAWR
jgi:tRNA(Ile)-lysidine synthase